jgi:hypothetical protein
MFLRHRQQERIVIERREKITPAPLAIKPSSALAILGCEGFATGISNKSWSGSHE